MLHVMCPLRGVDERCNKRAKDMMICLKMLLAMIAMIAMNEAERMDIMEGKEHEMK